MKKETEEKITLILIMLVFGLSVYMKDTPIATVSAVFGLLYTIYAGRGKPICYIFGMVGTFCYSYLSLKQALWGNLFLYAGYYFPMEIIGLISWGKNFEKKNNEIKKSFLSKTHKVAFFAVLFVLSAIFSIILKFYNDKYPVLDSITTILSIGGMYLTVKRCIEQWVIWTIVNFVSIIIWFKIFMNGGKTFATLLMWLIYFFLGIYFYFRWKRELSEK